MTAYATVDDLILRWKPLSPSEQEQAKTLLDDAAVLLDAEFRRNQKPINKEDQFLMSALKIVSCSIVKRTMLSENLGGFSQVSTTAGSFNEQMTVANPSGDMYLTEREYGMLGIRKARSEIAQIGPVTVGDDDAGR